MVEFPSGDFPSRLGATLLGGFGAFAIENVFRAACFERLGGTGDNVLLRLEDALESSALTRLARRQRTPYAARQT